MRRPKPFYGSICLCLPSPETRDVLAWVCERLAPGLPCRADCAWCGFVVQELAWANNLKRLPQQSLGFHKPSQAAFTSLRFPANWLKIVLPRLADQACFTGIDA